ncbi:hypothetical protein G9A89_012636 [Geosiphon pyriformis]|nr:hypothetical protein G9A89_012636 [Geosiphon pyriformis]
MLSKVVFVSSFVLATATSIVSAGYTITSPYSNLVWNKGDKVKVQWKINGQAEEKVDVRLVHGNAENLLFDFNLCSNVNPSAGECSYVVDDNIVSGIDYAVTVGKTPDKFAYSSYFTIKANGALSESKGCPNMGGKICPESLPCCSSSGYCGKTEEYCNNGCMAKYSFNGKCVLPGAQVTVSTPATQVSTNVNQQPPPKKEEQKPPVSVTPVTPLVTQQKKCGKKMCTKLQPCCSASNKCGNSCVIGCKKSMSFAGKCISHN